MSRNLEDWIQGYLEFVDHTEPSYLYNIWTAMSTIAACLQRKCFIDWNPILKERIYPNLYVILVGPSTARKGTAMAPGRMFLNDLNIKLAPDAASAQSLVQVIEESKETYIDSETDETVPHCSLTVFSPEFSVFIDSGNKNMKSENNIITWMTDWYDCKDVWDYKLKQSDSTYIRGMWINLLGCTTPSNLQTSLPQIAIHGGLVARMILVYASKKRKTVALPIFPEGLLELKEKLTRDLESISAMNGHFSPSREFLDAYAEWYKEQDKNPPMSDYHFESYLGRRQTHLRKMAIIMSASRSNDKVIKIADFYRAKSLLEATETLMPYVFASYGRRDDSDLMHRVIKTLGIKKKLSKTDLIKLFYRECSMQDLDTYLVMLKKVGAVDLMDVTIDGRKDVMITFKGSKKNADGLLEL